MTGEQSVSVGRLAPSPTGAQHLGNARTFLIAYWSARSQNARLRLRIEDIDSPRVKPWATQQAIDDLRWLGMDWQGEPIIQTERTELYERALDDLIQAGRAYPCTCSRKDIERAASAPHDDTNPVNPARGVAEATLYPGTCATWQRGDEIPESGTYCWRFRVHPYEMKLDDLIAGQQTCDPMQTLGDFPITRKGGPAAYQLAVVLDDVDAGVTEIVRGDDLIVSTFRQLQIYEALGESPPVYAHVPLVVGPDGRRLAKRHGDTRLSQYRDAGLTPETIVHWAASTAGLLGDQDAQIPIADWTLKNLHEVAIANFRWDRIPKQRIIVSSDFPAQT